MNRHKQLIRPGPDVLGKKNRQGAGYTLAADGPTSNESFAGNRLLVRRGFNILAQNKSATYFALPHYPQVGAWPNV